MDPRSTTGAWHIWKGRYGRRRDDKPWWWVYAYHLVVKPLGVALTILLWLALAWVAKKCGVPLPQVSP